MLLNRAITPLVLAGFFVGILAIDGSARAEQGEVAISPADRAGQLPAGSRIAVQTTAEITSKKARKGDLIYLETSRDIEIDGQVVIAAGTPAIGEVTLAEKKGMMGDGGKLTMRLLYLETHAGPIRMSGQLANIDHDQTELATLAATATMGLLIFVTGKTAVIPAQSEFVVELDRDARIPASLMAAAPPSSE